MNPREIDVLNVLFSTNKALKVSEIVGVNRELTQSTVTLVLRKMLAMNYVEVVGATHSGKVLSRTYRPTAAAKEAVKVHFYEQYDRFSAIISPKELCAMIKENYK